MSDLYNGNSESFEFVTQCYMDYANEVICRRAFPDLRDGQKKVTRRIIYSAYMNKKPTMQKCIPFVSDAVKLHPHGDQAVYGAFTLMTDENGSCNMPLFEGLGNLGKVYSSKTPADMRYPKARVGKNLEDFFRDKEVMELVPAEEGEGEEPEVLNAIYPIVLVNGTMGIAVSVATRVPSFNFGDVVDLTIKKLRDGKLGVTDVIVPDFPTGGVLVRDDTELAKIMATGKGKIKVRARVEIEGNQILVKEVPYGKTVESIKKLVDDSGMKEISFCSITVGRNAPALLTIECKTKKVVEYVLMELYRRNILQSSYSSNIIVTEKEVPYILGVHGIIDRWCAWRKSVVVAKCDKIIKRATEERDLLTYIKILIDDVESCVKYTEVYVREGKGAARNYLKEFFSKHFEEVDMSSVEWILDRKLSSMSRNATTYLKRYSDLEETIKQYSHDREHPDEYIIRELEELKKEKQGQYERRTEITYNDYKFSKISDSEVIEDTTPCVWTLRKDGFLMKTRDSRRDSIKPLEDGSDPIMCEFRGCANDVLIGFDNFGRILRVVGSEIPYTAYGENGVYTPRYFDAAFQENYRVLYLSVLDGSKKLLVYRDGYMGLLDTSEFVGKRNTKIISKGVNTAVMDKLLEVYEEDEIPMEMVCADDTTGVDRLGVCVLAEVGFRGRLSRTKIFPGDVNISYLKGCNEMELYSYLERPDLYAGKYRRLTTKILGDPEELLDGRYLGICKDLD